MSGTEQKEGDLHWGRWAMTIKQMATHKGDSGDSDGTLLQSPRPCSKSRDFPDKTELSEYTLRVNFLFMT